MATSEDRRPRLGVVIPVFNEAENILRTLGELHKHLPVEAVAYVIYDFPEDSTLTVLPQFRSDRVDVQPRLNGYGGGALNAIKWGLSVVNEEAVLVVMGDLSDDLASLRPMWEKFRDGYDVVCGSRYMPGGAQLGAPWLKGHLSRWAGLSLRLLTGLPTHDVTNSFKLYRKSVLDSISLESSGGFEIGMEIVVKAWANGYRVGEVPTTWTERDAGGSRFRLWAWLPNYLRWYFRGLYVGWIVRPRRG